MSAPARFARAAAGAAFCGAAMLAQPRPAAAQESGPATPPVPAAAPALPAPAPASPAERDLARATREALRDPHAPGPWLALEAELGRLPGARAGAARLAAARVADSLATALLWLRIDPVEEGTDVSIGASSDDIRVAPAVVAEGVTRLGIDLGGARIRLPGAAFPHLENGGVRAIRAQQDADGTHLTLELEPGLRFWAATGPGGLLLRLYHPALPARAWSASAPGVAPLRVQPAARMPRLLPAPVRAPQPRGLAAVTPAAPVAQPLAAVTPAAPAAQPPEARPSAGRAAAASRGLDAPLSAPQLLLLLVLVAAPPIAVFRWLRKRGASRAEAPAGAEGGAALPEGAEPMAPSGQEAAPAQLPRPARVRRWFFRRTAPPRPPLNAGAQLWAARTLARGGARAAEVARRTGLSRDAVALLSRGGQ